MRQRILNVHYYCPIFFTLVLTTAHMDNFFMPFSLFLKVTNTVVCVRSCEIFKKWYIYWYRKRKWCKYRCICGRVLCYWKKWNRWEQLLSDVTQGIMMEWKNWLDELTGLSWKVFLRLEKTMGIKLLLFWRLSANTQVYLKFKNKQTKPQMKQRKSQKAFQNSSKKKHYLNRTWAC